MHPPWLSSVWFYVHQTFCSWWCHRCWLEVERSIACFIHRFCWIHFIGLHQVASDVCLINKLAPVCDWDRFGEICKSYCEVILPCLDGSLCCVCSVIIMWDLLDSCILVCNECFNLSWFHYPICPFVMQERWYGAYWESVLHLNSSLQICF